MTVKIGDKTLSTHRPQDLDKLLLADFGCTAAEVARMLTGSPLAGNVARALLPFVAEGDRPDVARLALEISTAGIANVAGQVLSLYAEAGADDLDGLGHAGLDEVAERESVSLAGAKTLDDKRAAIRAARQAKAAAASEAG